MRDLGSALGDTQRFAPHTGHVESFERHPFIKGMSNGYVDFAYEGWYRAFVPDRITPADVAWASTLLALERPAVARRVSRWPPLPAPVA